MHEVPHEAVLHLVLQSNHTLIKSRACRSLLNETVDHLHAQVLQQHTNGQRFDDIQCFATVLDTVAQQLGDVDGLHAHEHFVVDMDEHVAICHFNQEHLKELVGAYNG